MDEEERLLPPLEETPKWKKGLTLRSLMAFMYAGLVFIPALMWLGWAMGLGLVIVAQYTTVLLFAWLSERAERPLTRQEAFIIYATVGTICVEFLFSGMIWMNYLRNSPTAYRFGVADAIPKWFAPPPDSIRTLLNPAWVMPIIIWLLAFGVIFKVADITMGYFLYRHYIVEEKLSFPMQQIWAASCIVIAERSRMPARSKIFTYSTMIGLLYGYLAYGHLLLTGTEIIPIPWIDLTPIFERILPGASFGIGVDIFTLASGFVIPWRVLVSMLIGSISFWVIGNHILVRHNIFPWSKGMSVSFIWFQSIQYFWASLIVGVGLAAGIMPIIIRRKAFIRTLKGIRFRGESEGQERGLPLGAVFGAYLLAATSSVVLAHFLAPEFPIAIWALLAIAGTFFLALVRGRAMGETGMDFGIPYLREGMFYAVGYTGINAWFTPIYGGGSMLTGLSTTGDYGGGGGPGWLTGLTGARLTATDLGDYFKAFVIGIIIAYIMNFIYVNMFWMMAPIPSAAYPLINEVWPVNAFWTLVWTQKALVVFKPVLITISFSIFAAIGGAAALFHLPIEMIGFAVAAVTLIPITITQFIGGIIGKGMARRKGKRWWDEYKVVIAAGFGLGEGLIVTLCTAIMMISQGMWILPF